MDSPYPNIRCWDRESAVGRSVGCSVVPIPGRWLGFTAQANSAFHASGQDGALFCQY